MIEKTEVQTKPSTPTFEEVKITSSSLLGKRKRKSERDLSYLRTELKKEFLWSREKIEEVA